MSFFEGLKKVVKGESTIDFVGRARTWFTISAILMIVSLSGIFIKGLNLGLAFEGGSAFSVPVAEGTAVPSVPVVEEAVSGAGLTGVQVQIVTSRDRKFIRVEAGDVTPAEQSRVVGELAELSGQDRTEVNVQNVGPTWGAQISSKALRALIVFVILVVVYISFRFEPKMALCASVSLVHDVMATVGVYALVGFEVTPATVVAYLTILGYSLYDSVVVFDKIRENQTMLGGTSRLSYSDMVNRSVNQTAMRSINTSLSSLLPVGALLFVGVYLFGAETLKDLALSLFIGIGVGSYSSIFLGPPLLAILKEREPRYKQMAARARTAGGGLTPAGAAAAASGGSVATAKASVATEEEPQPARERPKVQHRPLQPKGRKSRGGKRRR